MSAERRTALLGLAALAFCAALIGLSLTGGLRALFDTESQQQVVVEFADSQTLKAGDEVRIDGVEVGQVKNVEARRGQRPSRVTVEVDEHAGGIYADARAAVRWKTLLGGGFYLAIERGSSDAGALHGAIAARRTADQVELDDVTSILDRDATKGLQHIPREIARGLRDPASSTDLLNEVGARAPDIAEGVDALRGTVREDDLKQLVASAAKTVSALDRPDDALARLMSGAGATLVATGNRGADLRRALRLAPATMRTAETTFARLAPTLRQARKLLADLREPSGDVAPALRRLRPTVADAVVLVQRARPLVNRALPAARSLAIVAPRASGLLDDVRPSIDRLSKRILPALNRVQPDTQRTTATMIGGTFSNMGPGVGGQMDANGHFIRFPATLGSSPVSSLPCQTYLNNPDKQQLLGCQTLDEALRTYLSYQPLGPTPGVEPPSDATRRRRR
jgi:phospholipid/cholesterol/gamma-HCH transport system substrate-binding protein